MYEKTSFYWCNLLQGSCGTLVDPSPWLAWRCCCCCCWRRRAALLQYMHRAVYTRLCWIFWARAPAFVISRSVATSANSGLHFNIDPTTTISRHPHRRRWCTYRVPRSKDLNLFQLKSGSITASSLRAAFEQTLPLYSAASTAVRGKAAGAEEPLALRQGRLRAVRQHWVGCLFPSWPLISKQRLLQSRTPAGAAAPGVAVQLGCSCATGCCVPG
jgi:hypothetical protein